jgi:hypothetical protein
MRHGEDTVEAVAVLNQLIEAQEKTVRPAEADQLQYFMSLFREAARAP